MEWRRSLRLLPKRQSTCDRRFGAAQLGDDLGPDDFDRIAARSSEGEDMASIKVNDIVKEQRGRAVSGLFLTALWLISSFGYYDALQRKMSLEYLTAYLMIREAS